jgi:hypothetical protein
MGTVMRRVSTLTTMLVIGAAALTPTTSFAARSCGTVTAFGERFALTTYGGTSCRLARNVVAKYPAAAQRTGCGSAMSGGPCRIDGYRCATSGFDRFTCSKGKRRIVARMR